MKKIGHSRRLLSVLLALVMLLSLLPTAVFAADPTPQTYKKVTQAPEDWSGTYLIVSEGDEAAFDSSLTEIDVSNNYKTVKIAEGTIKTTETIAVTIEKMADGNYSIKGANGKYIYQTSDANGLKTGAKATANTVALNADGTVDIVSGGAHLRFNKNSDQMRFRYFKSATYTRQQAITLYKLDAAPARQSGIVTDLTTLRDGDKVVVFNPANGKTLSTEYTGHYNKGTDVTLADGKLEGFTDADKWTLGINDDGTYTFATADGKKLAMVHVKGSELLEALEASTFCTPISLGGFPQTAGMKLTVDCTKPYDKADDTYPGSTYYGPKSINRVTIESINGQPFDPDQTYAVITNNFTAAGGDTYYAFAAASGQFDTGLTLDGIVMEYITTVLGGVVGQEYAEPDGRMTVILPPDEDDGKITIGGLDANIWMTKYGNVYTDCKAEKFMGDMGFNWGDLVTVEFLGKTLTLPVIPTYSYVDSGKPAIIVEKGEDGNPTGYVSMAINMGNFAETYELAVKHTDEDKNWYWTAWEGVTYPVEVTFTMAEKDGYRAEYILHELQRTNDRADYPDLTDEEFANFRNVATTGMGKNLLYRGSSPINPQLGRSGYADAALKKAGVTVIMNLADSEADAKAYAGFADTYYAGQKVIYLNLGVDFTAPEFQAGLADGLRFFAANKGVYYVHCTEGKDRAGFVNALLECLMGATFNEVVEDYMTTYYNYYGVEPGTDKYTAIAESNIIKTLQTAFGVEDLSKADLQKGAKDYMKAIGLTDAEITSLMTNLGYKAPATGDTGVVLYVGLAVLALTGGVFVARRKELF